MSSELEISTATDPGPSPEETLREIVRRTGALYSLPAVAVEVIQLTSNPQVDACALKQRIEKDPALTVKILRVVNSSLFGLSREVSDLNQALALLGTKPLKLLVLGFSLPEGLFVDVAREQLDWYWRTTLVRAVAAREISEQLWHRSGDDAFLAGLLQDIGVLVLLDQLREPYAQFLGRVIEERGDLNSCETESLGFDHTQLTACLLRQWNMPDLLVEAIAENRDSEVLAQQKTPSAELAQVLHLAGLLAELVGQNRLHVLPELLEAGEIYCGFDNERLHELIPTLQEKVQQLAEVLSLDLPEGTEYSQVLIEAHAQMAMITEEVAERLSRPPSKQEKAYESVLEETAELQSAMSDFLHSPSVSPMSKHARNKSTAVREPASPAASPAPQAQYEPVVAPADGTGLPRRIAEELTWTVGDCRSRHLPVSLMFVELKGGNTEDAHELQLLKRIVETACYNVDADEIRVETLTPQRWGLVLPNCDRQQAVRHAHEAIREVNHTLQQHSVGYGALRCVVSVGVEPIYQHVRESLVVPVLLIASLSIQFL